MPAETERRAYQHDVVMKTFTFTQWAIIRTCCWGSASHMYK